MSHSLKLGTVLYSTSGYNQTKVRFYEVTELCGKTMVKVRRLANRSVSSHGEAHYKVMPVMGTHYGDPVRRKVKTFDDLTGIELSSFEWGSVWDGKPKLETDPRFGH